jgi:peptidoglycan/LPS O-acetylase OafA/YrhL
VAVLSEPRPRFRLGYRPELDGLRALAVVLVVLHHTGDLLAPTVVDWLAPGGYLGVDVFFVLSGFLITALLLAERERVGRIRWGGFLARRARRLLPALVFFLGVYLVISPLFGLHSLHEAASSVTWALTYLQNWPLVSWAHTSEVFQTWSLAIEAQFYVGWSLVVVALVRLRVRTWVLGALAAAGVAASALWRMHDYSRDHNWLRVYVRTFDRADSLLIGCFVAVAVTEGWLRGASGSVATVRGGPRSLAVQHRWQVVQGVALVGLLAAAWFIHDDDPVLYSGLFTCVAAAAAAVILGGLFGGPGLLNKMLASRPAVAVGKISYALYLWHYAVFFVIRDHAASWPAWTKVAVAIPVSLALSTVSYFAIERPFLRRRRAGTAPATPSAVTVAPVPLGNL